MENLKLIQTILLAAPPVLLAVTLHEAAHAWAAYRLGDATAWREGRVSINPFRHVDIVGTLLVPAILLFMGMRAFGWAKPVPVVASNLRHPRRDMLWVAAGGPVANLLMAIGWTALLKLDTLIPLHAYSFLMAMMCEIGVGVNLVLMTFNLLPIPPLDGGRIVTSLLPRSLAYPFSRIERFGLPILMALLLFDSLFNILDYTLWPLVTSGHILLYQLFQLTSSI